MNIPHLERVLKALANRRRIQILQFLKRQKTATVSSIAKNVDLSAKATSKHLRILLNAGVVTFSKRGSYVSYRISLKQEEPVKKVLQML
jgi:ArsR family transcriptional regulator